MELMKLKHGDIGGASSENFFQGNEINFVTLL